METEETRPGGAGEPVTVTAPVLLLRVMLVTVMLVTTACEAVE
jgi:hypothetical protein